LFAVGETLYVATYLNRQADTVEQMKGSIWMNKSDWGRSWKPWLRGTALGFPFGTIPAGGAEIPTFLSYAIEKKLTKHPEEFGKGAIEGVAGPEAANNASATGTLVPLLTLGLPTTATAAIILAAFQQWGLQPGPLLFETQPDLIWGLIASMYTGNVILLILNLPLVGIWVKLLAIPRPLLYAGILIFATLGAYGLRNSWFDLFLLYTIGVIGFLMRRYDIPVAPILVGMILGPLCEQQFRRALAISQGDLSIFITQPISATVLAITALVLIAPPIWKRVTVRRAEIKARTPGI
jgi:putative tricarboxylic transport membrane protein